MKEKSMTALISLFSRAYHSKNNSIKVFDDEIAEKLITKSEYEAISESMIKGRKFFCPGFAGSDEKALRKIADEQLSPTPLGRAAFAKRALKNAVMTGARQYVMLGAGYDSFAYSGCKWAEEIEIFEMDRENMICDKIQRLEMADININEKTHFIKADITKGEWRRALLENSNYSESCRTVFGILGLVYYISKSVFENILDDIYKIAPEGSCIVFDYPDDKTVSGVAGKRAEKQVNLAKSAGEEFKAVYAFNEMETILGNHGFLAYEHLIPEEITEDFFAQYNAANKNNKITAFDNVNYCLAVKKI